MPEVVHRYRIKSMRESLLDVPFLTRLDWTLGYLSELLKVTKKHLRRCFKVLKSPELEDEILEKDKLVKRTFCYGFRRFILEKKGKKRQILAPHPAVQEIFSAIKEWLESKGAWHANSFGFVPEKNPKLAAEALLGQEHFFGFDIADAFPSITSEMVAQALERLRVSEQVLDIIAWLVTYDYNDQRRLPQGSSCSPLLLNLVYQPMCDEIQRVCERRSLVWNVYADDFNFAGRYIPPTAKEELLAIPPKYGFSVKEQKTRDNLGRTIPHVLGLTIVNGKVHINRQTKNRIRRIIFAATKFGAYSPEQVAGAIGYVRHIYGDEENWPGSLRNVYQRWLGKSAGNGRETAEDDLDDVPF